MAEDFGDKTEAATPRRRQEAREEGNVARSPDLVAALLLVGMFVLLTVISLTLGFVTMTTSVPLAMALIGLFVTVTGRDVLGHILGFLMFENGIFGLALLATYGLPGIVEAGVFLDLLVIVLIMEGVVLRIRREHDSIAVDRLRELRG